MLLTHEAQEQRLGYTLAFSTLLFAGSYNALAKGLTPFLSPVSLLILSEALTAVFILMTFGVVPLFRKFLEMDRKSVCIAILVGLISSTVAPLLFFSGLARTSAMNASLLSATEMLFIIILGRVVLGEHLSRAQMIGGGTILFGILFINVAPGNSAFAVHSGDILITLGGVTWATGTILFKKYLSHLMPELTLVIRNLTGIVVASFAGMLISHPLVAEVSAFPVDKILLLLAFTFFSRYLSLMCFYEALERLPATVLSLIDIALPVSGLVFAYLILGEHLESYQLAGGVFIVCGLLIEQISPKAMPSIRLMSALSIFHLRKPEYTFTGRPQALVPGHV